MISTFFLFMNHMVKVIIGLPMFCKSGISIFIFAENNYSIYAHTMLIKTPLLHQSSGPRVFLSLSLSGYFFGVQRPSEFTFLPGLLRPSRGGALHLHPIKRVPEALVNRASPVPGALLAFYVNQGAVAAWTQEGLEELSHVEGQEGRR